MSTTLELQLDPEYLLRIARVRERAALSLVFDDEDHESVECTSLEEALRLAFREIVGRLGRLSPDAPQSKAAE